MNKRLTKISKYMSFILKHEPGSIGLKRDPEGWLMIEEFVKNANAVGKAITTEHLHAVVAECEDKRFEISDDGLKIRAIEN